MLFLAATVSAAHGQTADDVVAKYVAATGGAERWAAVQTFTVSSRSPSVSFDLAWKKPGKIRIDTWSDAVADTDTRAFDGTSGWRLYSVEDGSKARAMSQDEIAALRDESDWMRELIDYRAKGHQVKLLGSVSVAGARAHRLELTRSSGEVLAVFIDEKSGLEIQRIKWARSPAGEDIEFVLPVGDYRAVAGLLLPHRVGPAQRSYQVDGGIPDSRFERGGPRSERDIAAATMAGAASQLLPVGTLAPQWDLREPGGRSRRLADFRGHVVVLDFFATWCVPCHHVMPQLERLHQEFSRRGLVVIGASTWERGEPEDLMRKRHYSYTLLLNGESIARSYGVVGLPTTYVIGPDGRIMAAHVGGADADGDARRSIIAAFYEREGAARTPRRDGYFER